MEHFYRVYDDSSGVFYEIRPDCDGLGCVEVTYHGEPGQEKVERCLTVPPAMAELLAEAITKVANTLSKAE